MRGITPIITTVLLLLLAIAAIGGSWVFIQRVQTSATASGSGQFENLRAQASMLITYDSVSSSNKASTQNDTITIKLANPSKVAAKVTQVILENSTGSRFSNTTALTISPDSFKSVVVVIPNSTDITRFCPDETYVKLTVYSDAYKPIADYPVKCDY